MKTRASTWRAVLTQPVIVYVLAGYFAVYAALFLTPVFLNSDRVMQFPRYIPTYDPIGNDWQFMRTYGWTNYQEGAVDRLVGTGRYVISYAHNPTSIPPEQILSAHEFGRLRVTVLKTWDNDPS